MAALQDVNQRGRERSHSVLSSGSRSVDGDDEQRRPLSSTDSLENASGEALPISATRVCPPTSVARILSCSAANAPAGAAPASDAAAVADDSSQSPIVDHAPNVPIRLSVQSFRENKSQGRAFVVLEL